jgi:hypothetical protein
VESATNNINLIFKMKKPATRALPEATWKPVGSAIHGRLFTADKVSLPATAFAFPRARKEPMTDAAHVRDAMARFNQVGGVTDSERDLAFANFQKAASHFDIQMKETDWHQFGAHDA